MRKKKDISFIIIGFVFLVLGVFAAYICVVSIKTLYNFFEKAEKTEAQIVDIVVTRSTKKEDGRKKMRFTENVYVSYEIDGVTYEHVHVGSNLAFKGEGDMVTIYYNPDNPYEIETIDQIIFPVIPFLFGVAFLFGAYIILKSEFRIFGKRAKFKATAICVKLPIAEVGVDSSVSRNGHPAFYVICEKGNMSLYPQELYSEDKYLQLPQSYKSDNWFYPEFDLCTKVGDMVPVYINPKEPKQYFVDVKNKETT